MKKNAKFVKTSLVFLLCLIVCVTVSLAGLPMRAESAINIDTNMFKLSSSTQTTTGTINMNSNLLQVSSTIDFQVGQGIAIANLEPVTENLNADVHYTWFAAKITAINHNAGQITLNRPATKTIVTPVAVKHDNYYVLQDISIYYNRYPSFDIKIPYGEYEVNAIQNSYNVDIGADNSVRSYVFSFNDKTSMSIDFSSSKILFNNMIYLPDSYPVGFMTLTDCSNVEVKNADVDGGGLNARRRPGLSGDYAHYGVSMWTVHGAVFSNLRLAYFSTDGMIVSRNNDGVQALDENGNLLFYNNDPERPVYSSISKNITLDGVTAENNARNNLSVSGVEGITIVNSAFSNAGSIGEYGGRSPQSGIDFEIERNNRWIKDINISDSVFYNNAERSMIFQFGNDTNITIDNILSYQTGNDSHFNVADGVANLQNFTVSNSAFVSDPVKGQSAASPNIFWDNNQGNRVVRFENCDFMGSLRYGLRSEDEYYTYRPPSTVEFDGCNFIMDEESGFSKQAKPVNFNGCNFYLEAPPRGGKLFDGTGYTFSNSVIYNKLPTPVYLNIDTFGSSRYTLFSSTLLLGNVTLSQLYPNTSGSTNLSNRKISTRAYSNATELSSNTAAPSAEISAADALYTETKQSIENELAEKLAKYYRPITGINLSQSAMAISPNYTKALIANVLPEDTIADIQWQSSNPAVAAVDSLGRVTGIATGTATVTASSGGQSASCAVTVFAPHYSLYQESDSRLLYSDGWTLGSTMGYNGGSAMVSDVINSTIHFTFTGKAFQIIGHKSYSGGSIDITVDEEVVAKDLSLYIPYTEEYNVMVYEGILELGKHNVTITVKSTKVRFDALKIDGVLNASEAIPTTFSNAATSGNAFNSASGWFDRNAHSGRVFVGDINGDGKDELMGISSAGHVYYALGNGSGDFGNERHVTLSNGFSQSWFSPNNNQRVWVADVNGDKKDDFIGVASNGTIYTSLNTSTSSTISFSNPVGRTGVAFKTASGWFDRSAHSGRVFVGDINGDGKADLMGISSPGHVYYALANANDNNYGNERKIELSNGFAASWFSPSNNQRVWVAQINGDNRADFLGVSTAGLIFKSIAAN